jgi:hypothetical protein
VVVGRSEQPSGVWIVRQGALGFSLPIVTGTQPGISDYLPAPYGLPGFAAPVEQFAPSMTPVVRQNSIGLWNQGNSSLKFTRPLR